MPDAIKIFIEFIMLRELINQSFQFLLVYIGIIGRKTLPDKNFTDSLLKSIPNGKIPGPASPFQKSGLNDMFVPVIDFLLI